MKTSKQDIHDLLAVIVNDVEEIKAQLNGNTAVTDAVGEANAISNDVVVGNGSTASNADKTVADVKRLLEQIALTCGKLPGRIKSYYTQLLQRPKTCAKNSPATTTPASAKGCLLWMT